MAYGVHATQEERFAAFMDSLGLNMDDPHLIDTPRRVAAMFRELLTPENFRWTTFPAPSNDMVVVRDIPFVSICAHHFLPFTGIAHIGYIPTGEIVGLSKLARCVAYEARRPQVQERLTAAVADVIQDKIMPDGVAVVIEARHQCMEIRGACAVGATTVTSTMRGMFDNYPETRAEFMAIITRRG